MTIEQLHIVVEQAVNKVAASTNRYLYPEQIDLFLNKAQNEIIKSEADSIGTTQLKVDRIRPFIVERDVPHREGTLILPSDYSYLISDSSYIKCGSVSKSVLYASLVKDVPDEIVDSTGNVVIFSKPTSENLEEFTLLEYMRYVLRSKGYEAYSDTYLPTNQALYGIIPPDCTMVLNKTMRLVVDGDIVTRGEWQVNTEYTNQLVPNVQLKGQQSHIVSSTPYYKSNKFRINSTEQGNTISLYLDNKKDTGFIVTGGRVRYVRKPRLISLPLGLTSELAEDFHNELVDVTANLILSTLGGKP